MSIECDMSRVPHSRGVQCGVLLDRIVLPVPKSLLEKTRYSFFSIGLARDCLFGILCHASIPSHELFNDWLVK